MASETILIVDDDRALKKLLVDLLEMEGFRPLAIAKVHEAELVLHRERVDLVLTDLWGVAYNERIWEPVASLRRVAGDVPIVVCTAHGQAIHEDPRTRGVTDIVIKPFDLDDLVLRLRRALASARQQDGLSTGTRMRALG